jgi:hypothetical protein
MLELRETVLRLDYVNCIVNLTEEEFIRGIEPIEEDIYKVINIPKEFFDGRDWTIHVIIDTHNGRLLIVNNYNPRKIPAL